VLHELAQESLPMQVVLLTEALDVEEALQASRLALLSSMPMSKTCANHLQQP
jgi:hypothetical protein